MVEPRHIDVTDLDDFSRCKTQRSSEGGSLSYEEVLALEAT